ncbi:hypothetical protein [Microbacterium suwonense]|uniref:DUF4352 domain-containing protein n=1 Tax=Microbacterium suwonense TaxID=683047 RepID=A0ABM8FXE8_9MICO|nr:hypothetical protein [Microbacterium suwonense]BDZ40407.1 hypothetical protein GCM10025863_30210 [Microbacterium suwonense]
MTAASSSPESAAVPEPAAVPERTLLTRVRRMASLIPTPWLLTAGGGVLLAATAGFGGLEEVPPPPVPTVAIGEAYSGSDLQLTVQGVELRSERGTTSVFPDREKGERVLAVIVDVVNTFDKPRLATSLSTTSPVVDGIRVEGIDAKPAISRADGSPVTTLQPDVPTRLELAWVVGSDDLRDGDELALTLPASTHRVGTNVQRGVDIWEDVTVGAHLTAAVREVATDSDGGAS